MSQKPFVLLCNDDGIHADGIQAVLSAVKDLYEPIVLAPARERSGAAHSISLGRDMVLSEHGEKEFAFDGTPVDCVHFALRNLLKREAGSSD